MDKLKEWSLIYKPLTIIENGLKEIGTENLWACFSGGHDSLVATFLASQHRHFKGVLHLDTGIGLRTTRNYVIDTCEKMGWNLKVYHATKNLKKDGTPNYQFYSELVMLHGFPNGNSHQFMYARLKEYSLDRFRRDEKKADRWANVFTVGIRWQESDRRKKYQGSYFKKESGKFGNVYPIVDFSDCDKNLIIKEFNLPRNPVYEWYCKSGECLCGAFAHKNELLDIAKVEPEMVVRIENLNRYVTKRFPWKWGERIPKWYKQQKKEKMKETALCYSCEVRNQ